MNLGDWVEFQTVVVRQHGVGGSMPDTRALARKRRGMVIGEAQVYDVVSGWPPALSNPRRVLLVAVSLHRCYKVFPADVQPAGPPAPKRSRRSGFLPKPASTTPV